MSHVSHYICAVNLYIQKNDRPLEFKPLKHNTQQVFRVPVVSV